MKTIDRLKVHSLLARTGLWALLLGMLFLLRSFFLLLFLTFVFAFIQTRAVDALGTKIRNRTVRAWIVCVLLLSLLTGIVVFLSPSIKAQTTNFVRNFPSYVQAVDHEIYNLTESYPIFADITTELGNEGSPTMSLLQQLLGIEDLDTANNAISVTPILNKIAHLGGKIFAIFSAFLLSLLFSFLIVLDLDNLKRHLLDLERSRLRFAFREFAPGILSFSRVLGHALEAQFLIALLNSLFTAAGLWFLGLGHYWAFLTTVVFLCSFIPVAGVFVSSVPICLVALQSSGAHTMLMAIIMILIIHMIEAYILNPRIYGSRMRLNPVIVLLILTIAGKLFYFWGLVLGVPLYTWFVSQVIRKQSPSMPKAIENPESV